MPTTGLANFDRAVQRANVWLNDVARSLGEEGERDRAYRALRAWLHTLRDQLPVDIAAHLGAQLPELIRGVYYEGWDPSDTPARHDSGAYVTLFAYEAVVSEEDVRQTARAVTEGLRGHLSDGLLDEVFGSLPHELRSVLVPA